MGARGVIATTMMDAYSVADTILGDVSDVKLDEAASASASTITPQEAEDWQLSQAPRPEDLPMEITEGIGRRLVTTYPDWKAVDAEEVAQGARMGKERERMGWDAASAFLAGRRQ